MKTSVVRGSDVDPVEPIYTTSAVARLFGVSVRTVCKWYETGLLPGFVLPASADRRFPQSCVVEFIRAQRMPIPARLAEHPGFDGYTPFDDPVVPVERGGLIHERAVLGRMLS